MSKQIEERGARAVFVGNGSPAMAAMFAEDYGVREPLYTDPSLKAYDAVGFHRGMGSLWGTLKAAPRAMGKGFFQGRTQGDALQQGGIVVVDASGEERYRYVSRFAGDHPSMDALVAAL